MLPRNSLFRGLLRTDLIFDLFQILIEDQGLTHLRPDEEMVTVSHLNSALSQLSEIHYVRSS